MGHEFCKNLLHNDQCNRKDRYAVGSVIYDTTNIVTTKMEH